MERNCAKIGMPEKFNKQLEAELSAPDEPSSRELSLSTWHKRVPQSQLPRTESLSTSQAHIEYGNYGSSLDYHSDADTQHYDHHVHGHIVS